MQRWRIECLGVGAVLAVWLGGLCLSPWMGHALARQLGPKVLQATRGNVAAADVFLGARLRELTMWVVGALVAWLIYRLFSRLVRRGSAGRSHGWAAQAVLAVVLVNVWLFLAAQSTTFWCLMWQGEKTSNLARFRLKAGLLQEYPSASRGIILGNSQARAQIDEELLNQQLGTRLHTAELHFPGSRAFDIGLAYREANGEHAQVVICYLSELSFYAPGASTAAPLFFGLEDWGASRDLPVTKFVERRQLGYGMLSDLLPVFQLRDVLSQRLLGAGLAQIKERPRAAPESGRAESILETAATYRLGVMSDFQKRAFRLFANGCRQRNQKLVLLAGQMNPAIAKYFDPSVRPDFLVFLRELRADYSNVVLLDELPEQEAAEYVDLTHVTQARQRDFTQYLAQALKSKVLPTPLN